MGGWVGWGGMGGSSQRKRRQRGRAGHMHRSGREGLESCPDVCVSMHAGKHHLNALASRRPASQPASSQLLSSVIMPAGASAPLCVQLSTQVLDLLVGLLAQLPARQTNHRQIQQRDAVISGCRGLSRHADSAGPRKPLALQANLSAPATSCTCTRRAPAPARGCRSRSPPPWPACRPAAAAARPPGREPEAPRWTREGKVEGATLMALTPPRRQTTIHNNTRKVSLLALSIASTTALMPSRRHASTIEHSPATSTNPTPIRSALIQAACLVDGLVDALDAVAQAVHRARVGLQLPHLGGQVANGGAALLQRLDLLQHLQAANGKTAGGLRVRCRSHRPSWQ